MARVRVTMFYSTAPLAARRLRLHQLAHQTGHQALLFFGQWPSAVPHGPLRPRPMASLRRRGGLVGDGAALMLRTTLLRAAWLLQLLVRLLPPALSLPGPRQASKGPRQARPAGRTPLPARLRRRHGRLLLQLPRTSRRTSRRRTAAAPRQLRALPAQPLAAGRGECLGHARGHVRFHSCRLGCLLAATQGGRVLRACARGRARV